MKKLILLCLAVGVFALGGCAKDYGRTYITQIASPVSTYATLKDYKADRITSEDRPGNADFKRIDPGQTLVVADIEGPGEITHIWCTINALDPLHLRKMVLRVYYNGSDFPSVESPIGDFFGLGHARYYDFANTTQAIGTIHGMNSFWPMPFEKSARIEITNESDQAVRSFYYYVDFRRFDEMPEDRAYFHAQYLQSFPAPDKQPYLLLDTEGARGHFMGVHMSIHTQVAGWWGEGDDIFTIDGEEIPSMWGTGSEDYFCGAWCYGETFYNDYFGMPYREKLTQEADNYWNVYRYHIENPIPFDESLKVEIEHGRAGFDNTRAGGWNNDHSSVAYWYMEKPVPLKGELPPVEQRLPQYRPRKGPDNLIETSQFERVSTTGRAKMTVQGLGGYERDNRAWFFSDHIFCQPNEQDSVAQLEFTTEELKRGEAVLFMTKAPDYGIVRIYLNGKVLVEEFDGYSEVVEPAAIKIGNINLPANEYTMTIETIGKNPQSRNYLWGLDYFRIGGEATAMEATADTVNLVANGN